MSLHPMTSQFKSSLASLVLASAAVAALLMIPFHPVFAGSVLFLVGFGLIVARDYGRPFASLRVRTREEIAEENRSESHRLAA